MIERRIFNPKVELRVAAKSDGKSPGTLVGYAAIFSKAGDRHGLSEDLGGWAERCDSRMFGNLAGRDIRSLFNHDVNRPLGRTLNNTLRLSIDNIGLRTEIVLPDTSSGRDVAESVKRQDVSGMSFAFSVNHDGDDDGESWGDETFDGRKIMVRTLRSVTLRECGPVVFPAYDDTHVGAVDDSRLVLPSDVGRSMMFPNGIPAEIRSHVGTIGEPRVVSVPRRRNVIDLLFSL